MERISAASNMIIEVQPESWRLLVNGGDSERVLVEAVPGEPLRYVSSFGSRRRLPEAGLLQREDIQRIVLGWSEKDEAWHLGLVLRGALVDRRGSRWCGLAHWHDPLANRYQEVAAQAGQMLAQQVARPFTMIPPNIEVPGLNGAPPTARHEQVELPLPEVSPQPEMPLKFDLWTLRQLDPKHLELKLSPAWGRSKLIRTAWNIVWLGVFIILTVTTLTSGIALPRPELLVYLGFASIFVLVVLILYNLIRSLTYTNRILFERAGVRWMRGRGARRAIPTEQIQSVYVSLVIGRAPKRNLEKGRAIHHGELNLYLKNGKFQHLLTQSATDERISVNDDPFDEERVVDLTEYNAHTQLQAAGLYLAECLGISATYDKRVK
jgi:hypothetical protein